MWVVVGVLLAVAFIITFISFNINIISNKAFCSLNVENDLTVINEINLSQSLPGTIYYWELNLKGEKI